jgi:hypothetical protein
MRSQILSTPNLILIITAIIGGTLARLIILREDYRQYPTYPNGFLSHASLGLVAATLGSVFVPSIMSNNFTAATFLTLAITQFQSVRKLEQDSLTSLEETEYTKRGSAYIDGIAKTFEARNYIALFVSLTISIIGAMLEHDHLFFRIGMGLLGGIVIFIVLSRFSKGKIVSDLAEVKPAKINIKNNELFVDDFFVTNRIGISRGQDMILKEGLAAIITPKENHYRITLDNYGQRQAILFEITRTLGLKRYHYTRKNYEDGRIAFVVVPIIHDIETMVLSIQRTPILETVQKNHKFFKKRGKHSGRS